MSLATMKRQLLASLPGLPLQMAGAFLQQSYEDLSRRWEWSALETSFSLVTPASKTAGTIAVTKGSTDVTGTTTAFADTDAGRLIKISGSNYLYTIASRTNQALTLSEAYLGDTDASTTYEILTLIHPLTHGTRTVRDLLYITHIDRSLEERQVVEIERRDPDRSDTGDPTVYAKRGFTAGVPQIELWPRPTTETILQVRARLAPATLTDSDTPELDENLVVGLALLKAAPAYQMINPEAAKLIQSNLGLWSQVFTDSYTGAVQEDVGRHSTARKVRDVVFSSSSRDLYQASDITIDYES